MGGRDSSQVYPAIWRRRSNRRGGGSNRSSDRRAAPSISRRSYGPRKGDGRRRGIVLASDGHREPRQGSGDGRGHVRWAGLFGERWRSERGEAGRRGHECLRSRGGDADKADGSGSQLAAMHRRAGIGGWSCAVLSCGRNSGRCRPVLVWLARAGVGGGGGRWGGW